MFVMVSVGGARLLSGVRFFELLNLKALDAQFVLRGKRPVANIALVVSDRRRSIHSRNCASFGIAITPKPFAQRATPVHVSSDSTWLSASR